MKINCDVLSKVLSFVDNPVKAFFNVLFVTKQYNSCALPVHIST